MRQSSSRGPRAQRPQVEGLETRTLLSSGQPATETKPYYPPGLITPAAIEAGLYNVKPISPQEGVFFNTPVERAAFVAARPKVRAARMAVVAARQERRAEHTAIVAARQERRAERAAAHAAVVATRQEQRVAYIDSVYHTLLDRSPSAAGVDYWLHVMDRGKSARAVYHAVAHSREHRELLRSAERYTPYGRD